MPTYDYRCNACKHEFELFQSMKDKPQRKCPNCGKNALERLIGTGAAIVFKGSGFYQTDYRSDSYKKSAEADKPADSKTEAKAESKSEPSPGAKPDTKAEPKSDAKPDTKPDAKPKADPKPVAPKSAKPKKPD